MRGARKVPVVHIIGTLVMLLLLSVMAWLLTSGESKDSSPKPRTEDANSWEVPASAGPSAQTPVPSQEPITRKKIAKLEDTVDRFVEAQYSRDANLTEEGLRSRLSPVVTDDYLVRYPPDLSTESDDWVRLNNGVITATAVSEASDEMMSGAEAFVYVDVTVKGVASGKEEPPYTFPIRLRVVWDDGWRIDSLV